MARWRPGSAARMQQAAIDLFARQGFDRTTAAEIAAEAGLAERTFFRHFADKRDVLFEGQETFVGAFLDGIAAAPASASPIVLVDAALRSSATLFPDERRERGRLREAIIASHSALRERERHKIAALATEIAAALRDRGVPEPAATLAAESATTVFGVAFAQWLAEGEERSMEQLCVETLDALLTLGEGSN